MMKQIKNIAGYQFIKLGDLNFLQTSLHDLAEKHAMKGTILLSQEGININMAGEVAQTEAFQASLLSLPPFNGISFHETYSDSVPFKMLKVKIKPEIVTLRQPKTSPAEHCSRAPGVSPFTLRQWLDEKRDITLLDTRNDFEYRFGTFVGSINPNIQSFGELPDMIDQLDRDKPVVMFCTGGIRCEKAAIYMQNHGFEEVYQLDGGILGYFRQVGGAHYEGECFVFDERVAVDASMCVTGTAQCVGCQGPVPQADQQTVAFIQSSFCVECSDRETSGQSVKSLHLAAV